MRGDGKELERLTQRSRELAQRDQFLLKIIELRARRLVERMALVLQGSLLVRYSPPAVADAFCASRLGGDWGNCFGTLPSNTDTEAILDRSAPKGA